MKVGKRIAELLLWASNHSPRSKELRRYIDDLHEAFRSDLERSKKLIEISALLQRDRDAIARVAFKLAQQKLGVDEGNYPIDPENKLTDEEYRLYASARINQLLMPIISKKQPDQTAARNEYAAQAEIAFGEVKSLGCSDDVIADMRTNFMRSLEVQPVEDQELAAAASDVAVVSTGG